MTWPREFIVYKNIINVYFYIHVRLVHGVVVNWFKIFEFGGGVLTLRDSHDNLKLREIQSIVSIGSSVKCGDKVIIHRQNTICKILCMLVLLSEILNRWTIGQTFPYLSYRLSSTVIFPWCFNLSNAITSVLAITGKVIWQLISLCIGNGCLFPSKYLFCVFIVYSWKR